MKALERHGQDRAAADAESATPKTEAEKKIAAIWKDVLGVKKVRADINFFDAGGTSIQLAQVKTIFGRNISMTELFQFPSISSLAAHLTASAADSLGASLSRSEDHAIDRRAKMLSRKRSGKIPLGSQEKR